ncbi:MAG: HAMP domain-containing sensor histidine kinase [Eubacteriales bacterium]|nr:HAMP domain-containing sensor histidine kinase [Eubacteriales bacterium]
MKGKLETLTRKMLCRIVKDFLTGLALFLILYYGSRSILMDYLNSTGYLLEQEKDRLEEFQDFVTENQLTAMDAGEIRKWAEKRKLKDFLISRDGFLCFDISYHGVILPGAKKQNTSGFLYEIWFEDGKADVSIYEGAADNYYDFLLGAAILLGVLCCLSIFAYEIQEDICKIRSLECAVQAISTGDLTAKASIAGKDELAQLAAGIDKMRLELIRRQQRELELRKAEEDLVLGMAHDLRTPLTGLFSYLEIIREYEKNGKNAKEYSQKAFDKAQQIKTLSDQMFEYFLASTEEKTELEEPEFLESALGDYLSELLVFLESKGFVLDTKGILWRPVRIRINADGIGRVMNNIASNIEKYADQRQKITLKIHYEKDQAVVMIQNGIDTSAAHMAGTGIGVKNIRLMMRRMGGEVKIAETDRIYQLSLYFPLENKV